jgi:multidrug resistance protein, MATE family
MTTRNIRSELREFLHLAIPLASAQLAQAATGFVDTLMMGWLGTATLAAGGLAATTFMAVSVVGTGLVLGMTPVVAAAHGSGELKQVSRWSQQGLWFSLLVALPLMGLTGLLPNLMLSLGQQPEMVAIGRSYLQVVLWGLWPALFFALFKSTIGTVANPRIVTVIVVSGLALNAVGNYILAFGKLGFPAMGLVGLAIATVASHWFMALSSIVYALVWRRTDRLLGWVAPDWELLQHLYRLGWPLSVSFGLEVGLFTIVTYLIGTFGPEALAAHQMVFQTIVVIFMVPLGMSLATTVRVGQYFGRGDRQGLRRATHLAMVASSIFMMVMSFGLLLWPQRVLGLYLDLENPDNLGTIALGIPLLRIAAIAQIADGLQTTIAGALRGLQDTRTPMLLGFVAFWGVGLQLGYWLGLGWKWGPIGLWIGQSLGVLAAALLFYWQFHRRSQRL